MTSTVIRLSRWPSLPVVTSVRQSTCHATPVQCGHNYLMSVMETWALGRVGGGGVGGEGEGGNEDGMCNILSDSNCD